LAQIAVIIDVVYNHLGTEALNVFKDLPGELLPWNITSSRRATASPVVSPNRHRHDGTPYSVAAGTD
jgi:hypothetical protein